MKVAGIDVVNDALQVARDQYYVGRNPWGREGHTFVLIVFFSWIVTFVLLVEMAGVCVERLNDELNLMVRGRLTDAQRNVNLSPGAAPVTSRFSSRICSVGPSQS